MAVMEFRWQYCHTKFIQELQNVITTSSVLNYFETSIFIDLNSLMRK